MRTFIFKIKPKKKKKKEYKTYISFYKTKTPKTKR